MQKISVAFNAQEVNLDHRTDMSVVQAKLYVALQTSMDLSTLLSIFKSHVQQRIQFDSLSLANLNEKIDIQLGEAKQYASTIVLETQGSNIGALNFSRNEPFTESEQQLLGLLVKPLAYPLRNAMEFKKAVQTSLTDPLTNVGNRAAMEIAMQTAFGTANRYNQDLSIMLIDLDYFKKVNDQYGHLAGDKVLKSVASVIKQTVRCADQVFRFGGEEFLVLMPNTDMLGAFIIGDRIRGQIELITCICNRERIRVTASVGLASQKDGEDAQTVLDCCDQALYRAKTSGRNCVCSG